MIANASSRSGDINKIQEYAKFGKSIYRYVKHGQVCKRMVKYEKLFEKKYNIQKCKRKTKTCLKFFENFFQTVFVMSKSVRE